MPRDDESALIYLTVGVIPPLVMVPSAFIVRSNGRSNAYACRAYLRGLKDRIVLEREMLDSPGEGREVKVSDSDAQAKGSRSPHYQNENLTPIVPIREMTQNDEKQDPYYSLSASLLLMQASCVSTRTIVNYEACQEEDRTYAYEVMNTVAVTLMAGAAVSSWYFSFDETRYTYLGSSSDSSRFTLFPSDS